MTPSGKRPALEATLPGRLALLARERAEQTAIREKRLGLWQEISWRGYYDHVAAAARQMRALGVEAGDHVAIISDNRPEWLYADLAAQGLGARSVGVYQTNPPEDVAYVVAHSRSKILFCEDQEQVDKALEVIDQIPSCEHIVVFDPRGTRQYTEARLMSWASFVAQGRTLLAEEGSGDDWFAELAAQVDPAEPCMIIYTSGTTGPPKGAMISSRNVIVPRCVSPPPWERRRPIQC